jgi:F-type H+-transporting ATPase subunit delta
MAEAITIARPYATAIFRLAKEKKALAKWSDELALIAAVADNAQVKVLITFKRTRTRFTFYF